MKHFCCVLFLWFFPKILWAGTVVKIETSVGDIVVELEDEKAPLTVSNFLHYVDTGFYSDTIFHRVISNFMIQGGGFTKAMTRKPTSAPIQLEAGLSNKRGSVAMARTAQPNSASSQFYINVVDNLPLDTYNGGYAVFGTVINGMDTVDKIAGVKTKREKGQKNVPVEDIVIQSISRVVTTNEQR